MSPAGPADVGGQVREGYVHLQLVGAQALRLAGASIDADGRFELTARAPGTYRLVVHADPQQHGYRLVSDLVTLVSASPYGSAVWPCTSGRKTACVSIAVSLPRRYTGRPARAP